MTSIASPARSQGLNVKRINSADVAAAAIATGAHHAACTSTATPATTKSSAASSERLMAAHRTLPNIGERLVSNGTLAGGGEPIRQRATGHALEGRVRRASAYQASTNPAAA